MNQNEAIQCFAAIAHDGRLSIMRRLIKSGPAGIASGELAKAEKINHTTASAQLLILANAGLVISQRVGKKVFYSAEYSKFQTLIKFLVEDCCKDACNEN